jgi:hypothetical protein
MQDHDGFEPRSTFDTVGKVLLVGALAMIAWPAIKKISGVWRVRHPVAMQEPAIDKSLNDSYPASDPPASRYFDIPVNRR